MGENPGVVDTGWFAQTMADVPSGPPLWLSPGEAHRAESMTIPKRRSEFLLGRWTAKVAVAIALGSRPDDTVEVAAAPDGSPFVTIAGVRAPITISLTHRAGTAAVLIDRAIRPVGCDLELVEPRTAAFVADYLTPAEQCFVGTCADGRDLAANLVWSAKESVLKLLRDGLRRPALDVEVTVGEVTDGAWTGYRGRMLDGRTFPGWWRRLGGHILTVAYDTERPPPTELSADR